MGAIRIFCNGSDTKSTNTFKDGAIRIEITRQGKGYFLEENFDSPEKAEEYCEQLLKEDASKVFYLLNGDVRDRIILDHAFHQSRETKRRLIFGIVSCVLISLWGLAMSLPAFPDHSVFFYAILTLGIGAVYVLLHLFMGTGNAEAAVTLFVLLILWGVLANAIHQIHEQKTSPNPPVSSSKSE